jgi:anti-sigma factor RsiW
MEHSHIEEKSLIDRYVRGTMPLDERAAFEEHFLDCRQCLEELEVARSLRDALKQTAVLSPVAVAAPRRPLILAWATALALAALPALFFYRQLDHTRMELAQLRSAEPSTPVLYSLSQTRGAGAEPAVTVALPRVDAPRWIVLSVELDVSQFKAFRATLRDRDGQVVWQQNDLHPTSPDGIAVSFWSNRVNPGDYTLTLEGLTAQGRYATLPSFAIRVAR